MEEKEVVIIGGGPAGYAAAIRVAQLGGKATLIEKEALGGTCLNRGCIPVKALSRAVELIDLARNAKEYGINYKELEVNFPKIMARKDIVVKTMVSGVKLLLNGNGVEVIEGTGRFLSPSQLEVQLKNGDKKILTAHKVIIATGSRCEKGFANDERVIDTDEALQLETLPESMLIMGGGFIGLSFATIFSKLGTKVIIVEKSERILPEIDAEIVSFLERELKRAKVQVYAKAQVKGIEKAEGGRSVRLDIEGKEVNLPVQYVLMAEERRVNINDLGLEGVGIKLNDNRGIAVNRRMETNVPNVFAAGDVTGGQMWANVAFAEGIVAAENALGKNSEINHAAIPYWTNTLPEIAGIGMREDEAIAEGYQVKVGRFPFAGNGVATILGQRAGMIKIISEQKYGQILGVHLIGPQASNLIAEAGLAMKLEASAEEISSVFHSHPSLSEVFWEAARDIMGGAIHFPPTGKSET